MTQVATALGMQSIENHRRKFRFFCKMEPIKPLEKAKAKCKAGQLALIV